MNRLASHTLEKHTKLTFPQFRILAAIAKHQQLSQKKIAEFHGVTEAAISKMIDMLLKTKLIERKNNPKNRREKILTLLPAGLSVVSRSMRSLEGAFEKPLHALGGRRNQFASIMKDLTKSLQDQLTHSQPQEPMNT